MKVRRKGGEWRARTLQTVVKLMYRLAESSRRLRSTRKRTTPRRVVHVSPSYFDASSVVGGGERYALRLAEEMAKQIETVLVTFGAARRTLRQGSLRIEVYPILELVNGVIFDPLSYGFLSRLARADIVHCHQYRTVVSNLAILGGAIFGQRVFVTDHGGQGLHFTNSLPLSQFVSSFLPISRFSSNTFPEFEISRIIFGGVSSEFLAENTVQKGNKVVYVGRIMPHKGINYLIEAVDENVETEIYGLIYDEEYYALLKKLATGKKVTFVTDAKDDIIIAAYQTALVTVLPSVYKDYRGTEHPLSELLGLVLLESMACGTPVICTEVGGMPEIVSHELTGFVVPPNDSVSLRNRIRWMLTHPSEAHLMGQRAKQSVLKNFTWKAVVKRCLAAYHATD